MSDRQRVRESLFHLGSGPDDQPDFSRRDMPDRSDSGLGLSPSAYRDMHGNEGVA
jgi:hypothetical protein